MTEVTTVGNLLVSDALPEDLRKERYTMDKKSVHALLQQVAEKHPDQYKKVLTDLSNVGKTAGWTEGNTVSLTALRPSAAKAAILEPARARIKALLADDNIDDDKRKDLIIETMLSVSKKLPDAILEESTNENSPYVPAIVSGARGKKTDLNSLRGADLLVTDASDKFIPVPILNSYAEGLTPAEYFATTYGQRKGAVSEKLATADAGYLSKRLDNAVHRFVVTKEKPDATRLPTGLPVDTGDTYNVGAVLAKDAGDLKAGTILTSEMLEKLKDNDINEILIHSPMTEYNEDGGISAWSAGKRTRNGLHVIGDNIGLPAAQALGERLSQGSLGAKHSSGVKDKASRAGMVYINRLVDAPEHFPEAGPLAEEDGVVQEIRKAPQGGSLITVNRREYYAPEGITPTVKVGDTLEAGDELTDGVPHPEQLVRLRGIGEARKVFMKHFKEALDQSGVEPHRRNVETVVAGLLNWGRITNPDGIGDSIYDDVVPYSHLVSQYKPRMDAKEDVPDRSVGRYLEEPVLHYTPGTRITKKVKDTLNKWGIEKVYSHQDEPGFTPNMVRSALSVYHDPDWRTRLGGFYTSSAFQKAVTRGLESTNKSTSFFPAMATPEVLGRGLAATGKYASVR